MKATIVIIFVLLATASPTGEWSVESRPSLHSHAEYLTHLTTANDFLLPTIFTVCGSLLALSLIAVSTKSYVWFENDKVKKNGARSDISPGHFIPLYVHRVKQERMQSASKRPVTQVNGLPASSAGTDKEATVDDDRERCQRFTRLVLGVLFMILQNQSLARFILAEMDHPSRTSLGKER